MRDAGHRKQQPSGRDDGIGPLFNGHIDFQIWAELGLGLGLARNFLLQSKAKLTTGIPRANQRPTQDCLSRPQDSLSWLGLGAHEGYQWWQQTTSMLFQALRSCTNVQISWGSGGGGDLLDWLALQHIRGIQFYARFLERWLSLNKFWHCRITENVWENQGFLKIDHGLLCTPDLVYCFFELVNYSFQLLTESIKYMNSGRISWLWILIQIFSFPAILPWLPMMQLWAWTPLFWQPGQ